MHCYDDLTIGIAMILAYAVAQIVGLAMALRIVSGGGDD